MNKLMQQTLLTFPGEKDVDGDFRYCLNKYTTTEDTEIQDDSMVHNSPPNDTAYFENLKVLMCSD